MGLGLNLTGVAGAVMVLLFGFLFVTVSSRLTGEIGSSSNPISGMTVATLLLTCLILLGLSEFGLITLGKEIKLAALTIAAVVCIASSNGGTTSQALKTGYLVGATPKYQQYAILIGSLTSALVVGLVLLLLNQAGTVYTKKNLPPVKVDVSRLDRTDHVRTGPYAGDTTEYRVLNVGEGEKLDPSLLTAGKPEDVPPGRYLIAADGSVAYLVDPAVNGKLARAGRRPTSTAIKFDAPKTQLIALIINGILDRELPWDLVLIGVLIAVTLELAGVPALPFAVGVYLPLSSSTPIFIGGMVRWLVDRVRRTAPGDEGDTSPGVLLSSGYIAGGSIAAVLVAFLAFHQPTLDALSQSKTVGEWAESDLLVTVAFGVLVAILAAVGSERFGRRNGARQCKRGRPARRPRPNRAPYRRRSGLPLPPTLPCITSWARRWNFCMCSRSCASPRWIISSSCWISFESRRSSVSCRARSARSRAIATSISRICVSSDSSSSPELGPLVRRASCAPGPAWRLSFSSSSRPVLQLGPGPGQHLRLGRGQGAAGDLLLDRLELHRQLVELVVLLVQGGLNLPLAGGGLLLVVAGLLEEHLHLFEQLAQFLVLGLQPRNVGLLSSRPGYRAGSEPGSVRPGSAAYPFGSSPWKRMPTTGVRLLTGACGAADGGAFGSAGRAPGSRSLVGRIGPGCGRPAPARAGRP